MLYLIIMSCMRQYCLVSSTLDARFLRFMISYISQSAYRARDNRKFCQRIPRRAHHRSISCASSVGRIPSEANISPPPLLLFFSDDKDTVTISDRYIRSQPRFFWNVERKRRRKERRGRGWKRASGERWLASQQFRLYSAERCTGALPNQFQLESRIFAR